MRRLLLAAVLAAACGDDAAPAPTTPPPPKPPPARKLSDDTFELSDADNGKSKTIRVGDRVLIDLQASPRGVDDKHAYSWDDPIIEGQPLRFVNREDRGPPPHVDGGRDHSIFELSANDSGRAVVRIAQKRPAAATETGGPAETATWTYKFTIVDPD
jgi:hypothetical protein